MANLEGPGERHERFGACIPIEVFNPVAPLLASPRLQEPMHEPLTVSQGYLCSCSEAFTPLSITFVPTKSLVGALQRAIGVGVVT